jgi:phosphate transport system protein
MPQNIQSYRNDRKIIKVKYETILDLILEQYETTKKLTEKGFDMQDEVNVNEYKTKTNNSCNELLEWITWTISKQQPLAKDLRFLVAIISSIRDFRRLSDYSHNISRHLIRFGFKEKNLQFIHDLCQEIIVLIRKIRAIDINKEDNSEDVVSVIEYVSAFRNLYNSSIIDNIKVSIKDYSSDGDASKTLSAMFNFKGLERAADHIANIVENMLYVETGSFFDPRVSNINKNFKN